MKHWTTALACAALVALGAPAAFAQDGWINLFDGETAYGWMALGNIEWEAEDDGIEIEHKRDTAGWLATTTQFTDFELVMTIELDDGASCAVAVRAALDGHPCETGASLVELSEPKRSEPKPREVRIVAKGGDVTATVDGEEAKVVGGGAAVGHIGLVYYMTGEVELQSAKLKPINMTSIFNGEDLSEWNIVPGHASKFAVVDGAINIKDGNGQIETKGLYKNFLLQLDIISNGEHLNSGVFYRGLQDTFWKGYESQVRNQWSRDDRTRPVDFGTGGIYGNQQARKVVSTDGEWFEKTVVCNGNHMAVWIDGCQVSDFLDMRPPRTDGNGKEGYLPNAGTIHLQGHDPTTDLSFKNIMIQEYPAR